MARPVKADSARTRERIRSTSIEHFGRHGFQGASLRRIASDVGVTFATIHHHFGTKSDLFEVCVESSFQELGEIGLEVVRVFMTPPVETRLERAVRLAFAAASENRPRSRFLLRTFVFEDETLVGPHLQRHRAALLEGALRALLGSKDRDTRDLQVRLIGFGMLLTRMAAASTFEMAALGASAFSPRGLVEDYLIDVARATLSPALTSAQGTS